MRIAVFGGAFDPPHYGHLSVAQAVLDKAHADEVWFLPVHSHPFDKRLSQPNTRVEMVQLILQDKMKLCTLELETTEKSYTFVTLQKLAKMHPEHTFCFVIGSDNVAQFPKWFHARELLTQFVVLVYPREGSESIMLLPGMKPLTNGATVKISSTAIREAVGAGRSLKGLVPPAVDEYIHTTGLYITH